MLKKLVLALRYRLHLGSIERDVAQITSALKDQEIRTGIVLANNQQQLESIIRELGAGIVTERSRRDAIELKLAGSIAELTNEVRRLSDLADDQRRSTTFKQHDNDQQL